MKHGTDYAGHSLHVPLSAGNPLLLRHHRLMRPNLRRLAADVISSRRERAEAETARSTRAHANISSIASVVRWRERAGRGWGSTIVAHNAREVAVAMQKYCEYKAIFYLLTVEPAYF